MSTKTKKVTAKKVTAKKSTAKKAVVKKLTSKSKATKVEEVIITPVVTKKKSKRVPKDKAVIVEVPRETCRRSTQYNGVYKRVYTTGSIRFRMRLEFKGVEYGGHFMTEVEAAKEYNKVIIKLHGRKEAKNKGLLNEV